MVIKDDRILKATKRELHIYWIRHYDDICSWPAFLQGMVVSGTEITETEEYGDDD